MDQRQLAIGLITAALLQTSAALAQAPGPSLPVAISLVYNGLLYSGGPHGTGGGAGARFAGRIALPVGRRLYLGFAVGSWLRERQLSCDEAADCAEFRTGHSEAVVHQAYGQYYPGQERWFVRAGAGVAWTSTLRPLLGVFGARTHWRPAASAGLGGDLRLKGPLYLSASLDYTALLGAATEEDELHSGLAFGLGATLR